MSKDSVRAWDSTASNNTDVGGVGIVGSVNVMSNVDDALREIMSQVAEFAIDLGGSITAGGTADALTYTTSTAYTALANGTVIALKAASDNTGAATLNVNTLGAKAIRKMDSTGDVALAAGDIQATGIYLLAYSTALNSAAGAWLLLNPTVTLNGIGLGTTSSPTFGNLTLTSTDAGASSAPVMVLERNSASPADSDNLGRILFRGKDDGANDTSYAQIASQALDVTDTTEDGALLLQAMTAGTLKTYATIGADAYTLGSGVSFTVSGAFTSLGIDDNATGERFQLADTLAQFGTAGATYNLSHVAADQALRINGGDGIGTGANVILYAGSHASKAFDVEIYAASTLSYAYDFSGPSHSWYNNSGTRTLQIDSAGRLLIGDGSYTGTDITDVGASIQGAGATSPGAISLTVAATAGLFINRHDDDGNLVQLYQGGNLEGSISVSGTTIIYGSFCGAHWSQLSDSSRQEILRGTIVETIDEMCEWEGVDHEGEPVAEANDQLAKFKISDTVASRSVYGVFMRWDDDDDMPERTVQKKSKKARKPKPSDAYIAALGAFVIRIGSGETVSRGDLIESAGNGCGRVQADDLIRSSTVAKVTSPHVVQTYEDGSYLVPCTLHCG